MNTRIDRERHSRKNRRRFQEEAAEQQAAAPPAAKRFGRNRRLWLIWLICLLGSCAASFVVFKYIAPRVIAPSIPRELVGTWEVTEGDLQGATLEFRWYGTAIATLYKQGQEGNINFSVKVDETKIYLTTTNNSTGKADTVTQTIIKLTDDELIIRDEDSNIYPMMRVGN